MSKNNLTKIVATFALCAVGFTTPMESRAAANVTPLWLRDVMISPDGQQIAFCYKGDIYKVSVNGGQAIRLTTQPTYESTPIWSPDGKQIAFASDRHGNFDVFVMSSEGGDATRLTYNSTSEIPSTFTPDGKHVLFSASIQDQFTSALFPTRRLTELYKVPVSGGRSVQCLGNAMEMLHFTPDGKKILYQDQKGMEDEWRKHHTSSVTRDIWIYDTEKKLYTNLTNKAGEDRNPTISTDGKTVYFLSERNGGTFNVYSFPLNNPSSIQAVTNYKKHPVRFLSISNNNTLCYTFDGEIYTQPLNGNAKKVNITLTKDDEVTVATLRFSNGATEGAVSPDGKQIAFVQRGEVFVTSTAYTTTKQITHTPAAEYHVAWGTDNRTLIYASERDNGVKQLYKATITRPEDPNFPNATLITEEPILHDVNVERDFPQFSPDSKELAFIENRKNLMVYNLQSKQTRQITDNKTWMTTGGGFDYSWSPDSKWFTLEMVGNKRDPYYDIAIVDAQGKQMTNITESGYASSSPRWVLDGNAILFNNEMYGMRNHASWGSEEDAFLVFMNQDAYDKFRLSEEDYQLQKDLEKDQKKETPKTEEKNSKKKNVTNKTETPETKNIVIETKGIQDRIVRLTPNSSSLGSTILSKDGENLYYFASFERGADLWKISLRKNETKLLHKMNTSWASLEMDKDGNIFILGSRDMKKMDGKSEKLENISYSAEMRQDLTKEREYLLQNVYQSEKTRFYNTNMHGIDWDSMVNDYKKFLPHIDNNYDFAEMLSELLGELNVSHTGGRYSPRGNAGDDSTANLGLLFDMTWEKAGMKVDEILAGGPFDRASSKLKAGNIIEKINGEEITANTDIAKLMNGISRKKTLVSIYDPSTNRRWDEVILPITSGQVNSLLYDRWVKKNAEKVDKLSNGRLGYVHLQSMSDASFRQAYSDMLGKYNLKDGVIIDTRWNGGGRLHEDIEILVSGHKYLTQVDRGEETCDMPSRRWNKPTIMITCEANYSNAHGTPWVYQHQKLGKVVGAPVPGTMTTVNWVTTQDPTLVYGIPIIGYLQENGQYLENTQLEPDILILNDPSKVVEGEDAQLETSVKELLKQIDNK